MDNHCFTHTEKHQRILNTATDDKKDSPSKIVIVKVADDSKPDAIEKQEELRKAAEDYIGVKIEEFEGSDYAVALENKILFIIKPDRNDINSLEDLRGKTFAFVDTASTGGYMFPKYKLVTELYLNTSLLESPGFFLNRSFCRQA